MVKKVIDAILEALKAIGAFLLGLSWCITFVCLTFGLALWSYNWFDKMFTVVFGG